MYKKTWLAGICAVLSVGAVTACGQSSSSNQSTGGSQKSTTSAPKSAQSGVLNIGLSADPPKLDPSLSSALVDRQVMINIYDTLFQVTPDGKIAPDLVKSYTVSKDGKTYTLKLQKNVKFQDGTDFNAQAVKFNLERDLKPISPRRSELSEIQSVEAPNDDTVIIHLKDAFSPLPSILADRAGMMVSPTAVQKEGSNFSNHPVGTGPFEFQSQVKGDHITLVKNPHYWGTEPKLNKVVYKVFTDPNVELTNLESGAVQIVDTVPAQQLSTISKNASFVVSNEPGLGYQGIYLNTKTAPFNNKYLREAVDLAIDRKAIVDVVYKGTASAGHTPFSPASPVYNKTEDAPPTPDASKIKQLLAKGGKPNGFSFTLQESNSPVSVQMAQMIQSMLQQYGIKMDIQQLEFGTLLANSDNHAFVASQLGWSGRVDPDQNLYEFAVTGGSLNDSQYSNPKVDALLNKARAEQNMADRAKVYSQIVSILQQDVPYVYLYHQNNVFAYTTALHGFAAYPDGLIRVDSLSLS